MLKIFLQKYAKYIFLFIIIVQVCSMAWFYQGREKARSETIQAQLEFAQYIILQQMASFEASIKAKEIIEKVETDGQESKKLDQQKIADLESLLDSAHADNERVRQQLDTTRIRLSSSAITARECQTALDAAGVYSKLYGECITQYSKMAKSAQQSRTAGLTCERSYNAVWEALGERVK